MTATPILETPRLTLVLPSADHVQAHATFLGSDRAVALGWAAMPHEAWRSFAAFAGHHTLRGFGPLVAISKQDGRAVGIFGPWHPAGQPEPEVIWSIWAGADEGQGLAHEAALATRSYAYASLGWSTAVSYINPANTRSATLAQRLGAVIDHEWTTPRGTKVNVWRHPAPGALT